MLSPPKSQSYDWGRGVLLVKPLRGASQLYFTDYTLAGQPDALPSQESEVRWGGLGQALGEALLCTALANFISPITL